MPSLTGSVLSSVSCFSLLASVYIWSDPYSQAQLSAQDKYGDDLAMTEVLEFSRASSDGAEMEIADNACHVSVTEKSDTLGSSNDSSEEIAVGVAEIAHSASDGEQKETLGAFSQEDKPTEKLTGSETHSTWMWLLALVAITMELFIGRVVLSRAVAILRACAHRHRQGSVAMSSSLEGLNERPMMTRPNDDNDNFVSLQDAEIKDSSHEITCRTGAIVETAGLFERECWSLPTHVLTSEDCALVNVNTEDNSCFVDSNSSSVQLLKDGDADQIEELANQAHAFSKPVVTKNKDSRALNEVFFCDECEISGSPGHVPVTIVAASDKENSSSRDNAKLSNDGDGRALKERAFAPQVQSFASAPAKARSRLARAGFALEETGTDNFGTSSDATKDGLSAVAHVPTPARKISEVRARRGRRAGDSKVDEALLRTVEAN